jgi:cell division septation protein DedD
MTDSLALHRERLRALNGESFPCPLAPEAEPLRWAVQLGAFSSEANARRALEGLAARGVDCRVHHDGRLWRALAGRFAAARDAKAQIREWKRQGWIEEGRPFEERRK